MKSFSKKYVLKNCLLFYINYFIKSNHKKQERVFSPPKKIIKNMGRTISMDSGQKVRYLLAPTQYVNMVFPLTNLYKTIL